VLTIVPARLDDPEVLALIHALDDELAQLYPEPGANHFRLDPDEVETDRGVFLVARLGGVAVGCGAIRLLDPATVEVKRMFTLRSARGRGIGRALLAALEVEARRLDATRLVLETGARQVEAMALYANHGFARIPLFGDYVGSPASVCMAKELG
jgi:putative acetyltransferase